MRKYLYLILLLVTGIMFSAVQDSPKNLPAMLKDAERELDWQFFEEAKRSYLDILQKYPQQSGANEALGYICLMQQKYNESLTYFEKELALDPANDLTRLLLGIARFQTGDLSLASELLEKIAGNHSARKKSRFFGKFMNDNPGLIPFVLGTIYKEQGEWELAEEMMTEANEQKYDQAEIMVQLVDQYLQQQDSASAVSMLSRLERQNSQLAEQMSDIVKGQNRQKVREYARSRPIIIRYFKEPVSKIVDDLNNMAQNALKRAEPQSAIKTWKKALFADDSRFIIQYNIALIYSLYNFQKEALYHCRRAIDIGDSQYQPWALNLAGNVYFALENFEKALYYYQQALNLDSDYLKCLNNLGATYLKLSDLPNAEQAWLRVLKKSGKGDKESDILELDEKEKIKVFVDVKESDEMIEASKSLAALYIKQKQVVQAVPLLEKVLQFVPTDADAHFELGKIYRQLDKPALARQHLEAAIRNGTAFESEARDIIAKLEKEM